ncbi:MAG TPA: exodeoxyribonuclease VII small subunit [Gemmatimonadaceae bacterium]|jgi:exodeoxyribonuclease VII small subunit|nr:exodeoxyribonuclease VII small subunit [Gemmatimonadaceae bacterium]
MSYETDIARIETIVGELERSEVPLDDALRLFEEGIERLRAASAALSQAEARVRKLIEESDGGFTLADFES